MNGWIMEQPTMVLTPPPKPANWTLNLSPDVIGLYAGLQVTDGDIKRWSMSSPGESVINLRYSTFCSKTTKTED